MYFVCLHLFMISMYFVLFTYVGYRCILLVCFCGISMYFVCLCICRISMYFVFVYLHAGYRCILFLFIFMQDIGVFCFCLSSCRISVYFVLFMYM